MEKYIKQQNAALGEAQLNPLALEKVSIRGIPDVKLVPNKSITELEVTLGLNKIKMAAIT